VNESPIGPANLLEDKSRCFKPGQSLPNFGKGVEKLLTERSKCSKLEHPEREKLPMSLFPFKTNCLREAQPPDNTQGKTWVFPDNLWLSETSRVSSSSSKWAPFKSLEKSSKLEDKLRDLRFEHDPKRVSSEKAPEMALSERLI